MHILLCLLYINVLVVENIHILILFLGLGYYMVEGNYKEGIRVLLP